MARPPPSSLCFLTLCMLLGIGSLGCAFGQRHEYRVHIPAPLEGRGSIAVAVLDQRPDVLDGSADPDWVGMQRSGMGIPYDVSTESGDPLVDDWAVAMEAAMRRGGFTPVLLATRPSDAPAAVVERLRATGAQALMLFIVHRWDADTYNDISLHRDVVLQIIAPGGALMALARASNDVEIAGDFIDPMGNARKEVPRQLVRTVEWMLADRSIQRALRSLTGTPAPVSSR